MAERERERERERDGQADRQRRGKLHTTRLGCPKTWLAQIEGLLFCGWEQQVKVISLAVTRPSTCYQPPWGRYSTGQKSTASPHPSAQSYRVRIALLLSLLTRPRVRLGKNPDLREGRVSSPGWVVRRVPDEAMHAGLRPQPAVRRLSLHEHHHAAQPGLVAGARV